MGTAGLDVKRLAGLLERMKADCALIDGDAAFDHCVLRVSSTKRPGVVAYVEYENMGEPRSVSMVIKPDWWAPEEGEYPLECGSWMELRGARKEDPGKIAAWIEQEFLGVETRQRNVTEGAA